MLSAVIILTWLTDRLLLVTAFLQALVIALKVASLEMREVKVWVSSSVDTATALGTILAVSCRTIPTHEHYATVCGSQSVICFNKLLSIIQRTIGH